MVSYISIN